MNSFKKWIAKKILSMVVGSVASSFKEKLKKEPKEIQTLVDKLFNESVLEVNKWGLEKLYKGSLDKATFIDVLSKALEPVRDDVEVLILDAIKQFNPRV